MNKVIIVAFVAGRCGSSTIMGLLHRAGVNVGNWDHRGKNVENPGGFYETKAIEVFTYGNMGDQMLPFKPMPAFDKLREHKKLMPKLEAIFKNDYNGLFPLAFKDMHMSVIPMFEGNPDYDVRIIYAVRNMQEQCLSIQKVWRHLAYPAKRFEPWLKGMYDWMAEFKKEFPLKSITVDFNDVLKDPVGTTKKMCDFCEIKTPDDGEIIKWVNPKWARCYNGSAAQ